MPAARISPATRRLWSAVRSHRDWKVAAFVAFCEERGTPIDRTAVSHMMNGRRRTDSDTLMFLAEYFGDAAFIYDRFKVLVDDDTLELAEAPDDPAAASRLLVKLASTALDAQANADAGALAQTCRDIEALVRQLSVYADQQGEW